ncbi:MAG TPA: hypothetical protein VK971_00170 [Thiohalobacter sp.]|nr:hypothetical protein [Thiohalobacter sp.]
MSDQNTAPKWDVALAALAADAYGTKQAPLKLNDFRRLATEHRIRFDDLMMTLFELLRHGRWRYLDRNGNPVDLPADTLDRLYVNRRLQEVDLQDFDGGWEPLTRAAAE